MRPQKRRHNTIKGPVFPSFVNQSGGPKRILVWAPGTQSTRQVKKNLRNKARKIIDSTDPETYVVGDAVIYAVRDEPDPEYSALHLFCAALDASDETGESWPVCMRYIMSKFATSGELEELHVNDASKEAPAAGSRISRLLRSLVPRALRASASTIAERNVGEPSSSSITATTQLEPPKA